MKGLFITLEGLDGAGKTTQLHKAHSFYVKRAMRL